MKELNAFVDHYILFGFASFSDMNFNIDKSLDDYKESDNSILDNMFDY